MQKLRSKKLTPAQYVAAILIGFIGCAIVAATFLANREFRKSPGDSAPPLSADAKISPPSSAFAQRLNTNHLNNQRQTSQLPQPTRQAVSLDKNNNVTLPILARPADTMTQEDSVSTAENNNEIPLTAEDMALPLPADNNRAETAKGEHADQINQPNTTETVTPDDPPAEVAPDSHPPTLDNIQSNSSGETAAEVNQQILLDQAKAQGIQEDNTFDAPAALDNNVVVNAQGYAAQEVNRQGLIDRARVEGYITTDAENR